MSQARKRGAVMKLTLNHRSHEPSSQLTALIEKEIQALEPALRIDEARVSIERQEGSPPFRISAHLVTPGPDVCAEATDHTLRAALSKLIRRIRDKITHRSLRKGRRRRSHISGRIAPAH
jgi:ribosome-associated translation inhibitor RaiA